MTLAEKLRAVLDEVRALPPTREKRLALEKLEECAYWASCAKQGIVSGIMHVTDPPPLPTKPKGKRPS